MGYFAAGYPTEPKAPANGTTRYLVVIGTVVLVVAVIVAALPLAILRRRRALSHGQDDVDNEKDPG